MNKYSNTFLREVLQEKGYVRGPFGSALRRRELLSSGTPVYEQEHAIKGIREFRYFIGDEKYIELKRFSTSPGDLIISCSGTVGRISMITKDDPPGIISQALLILRTNPKVMIPEFLRYYLITRQGKHAITTASHGSVQVNIAPRKVVENIELPLPTIREQKAIAHILETLDKKIELNQKTNKTLEEIAKSLFKSWFVDFDPAKAKSEGRTTGLPDEISDLFPDSFEDSEDGMIPKNWNFRMLKEIAQFQNGYAFKSKEYIERDESSLEVFRMGYILRGGGFKEDNSPVFVDGSSTGYQKKYSLEKDDLTIAMTDMKDKMAILGCCALVEESNRFLLNQRVGRIRVKNCKIIGSVYLYLHMNYPTHIDQIRSKSNSGVQVNLSTDVIKGTPILIPDKLVMEKFSTISNDLFCKIFKNNKMTKTILEMRNILLPKLISGELRIPDAEKMIEEVGI